MINLENAKITDVMPPLLAKDLYTKCLAYALQQEHLRLLRLANATRLHSMIDDLAESILDILAVELRSPYYLETLDIEMKRYIIKRTLIWHQKAGTPNAVNELITIAFGNGYVVEWFNYAPDDPPFTPGTFDIITTSQLTVNALEYFHAIIYRVKNTRSHLRKLIAKRELSKNIFVGVMPNLIMTSVAVNTYEKNKILTTTKNVGVGIFFIPQNKIFGYGQKDKKINLDFKTVPILKIEPKNIILNTNEKRNKIINQNCNVFTGMKVEQKNIILNTNTKRNRIINQNCNVFTGMKIKKNLIIKGA